MFDKLTEKLSHTLRLVTGKAKLSESNIKETLSAVRVELLDADVNLATVNKFIQNLESEVLGKEIPKGLDPGQFFIKIVDEQLKILIGIEHQDIILNAPAPIIILMAGLQGSGKTTTCAKLAKYLQEKHKKKVMLVSCDIYRPAAILQLETVAGQVGAEFYPSDSSQNPVDIAKNAVKDSRKKSIDIVIVDTAGRLHIDDQMMTEIKNISSAINPTETLFIVDSMTGQDAAITADAFNSALELTGVILTKIDGDARGGAALSIRDVTGKPIKFLGLGEKLDALEPFHPDRIASRILGMGDVLSLVEDIERNIDKEKAEKFAKKIKQGKSFNLEDLRSQLVEVKKLGGMQDIVQKIPGLGGMIPKGALAKVNPDQKTNKMIAIINSMTQKERKYPQTINPSRKKRISQGSGTQVQDVNKLLKEFDKMQKIMKKFKGMGSMHKMMQSMQNMLPPGRR